MAPTDERLAAPGRSARTRAQRAGTHLDGKVIEGRISPSLGGLLEKTAQHCPASHRPAAKGARGEVLRGEHDGELTGKELVTGCVEVSMGWRMNQSDPRWIDQVALGGEAGRGATPASVGGVSRQQLPAVGQQLTPSCGLTLSRAAPIDSLHVIYAVVPTVTDATRRKSSVTAPTHTSKMGGDAASNEGLTRYCQVALGKKTNGIVQWEVLVSARATANRRPPTTDEQHSLLPLVLDSSAQIANSKKKVIWLC